jgi:hypothetical protein
VEKKLKDARARLAQSEKMASIGQLGRRGCPRNQQPPTGILFYAEMKLAELTADDPEREEVASVIEDVNRCKGYRQKPAGLQPPVKSNERDHPAQRDHRPELDPYSRSESVDEY